jgi:hypothetical protein
LFCGVSLLALAFAPPHAAAPLLALAAVGGGLVAPLLLVMPVELDGIGPARAGAALGLLMLVGQAGGFALPVALGWTSRPMLLLGLLHLAIVIPAAAVREETPALVVA